MIEIDIIILSYAKNENLKGLTQQTIDTCMASEDPNQINFKILVIESEKKMYPYQFKNTTTLYPKGKFNFNKYLNIGIMYTKNKFICICNNDLIFHKNWCSEILNVLLRDATILSAGPYCPIYHKKAGFIPNAQPLDGYFGVIGGWCIFFKRELINIIGLFDEKINFWYSDSDYAMNLLKYKIRHSLIPTSIVTHIGSKSLEQTNKKKFYELTQAPKIYYEYKWKHNSIIKYMVDMLFYKLSLLLK